MLIFFVLATLYGVVGTVILGLMGDELFIEVLVCTIIIFISFILTFVPISKSREKQSSMLNLKTRIVVDKEFITNGTDINEVKKPLSKVKKVIDAGICYYVIFKHGDLTNCWVCQKNLLIKGTLNEFETIFAEKLIRKPNNTADE